MAKKVALVTGSQQGIGFNVVRELCRSFDGDVIMTGVTEDDAVKARTELEGEGLKPVSHQLDVRDQSSVDRLRDFIQQEYGGLDILVNNAGVSFIDDEVLLTKGVPLPASFVPTPLGEIASETMKVNFYGTVRIMDVMSPLLRHGARVVHLGSNGARRAITGATGDKVKELKSTDWTKSKLCYFIHQYIQDVKSGNHVSLGWPDNSTYPMSMWAVWNLAKAQQKTFDQENNDVIVNAACPGIVATAMTKFKGVPVEKGCETILYLATLPGNSPSPKGELVYGKSICGFDALPPDFDTVDEMFKS